MQPLVYVHMLIQFTPLGALLANQHWALIHEGLHQRLPQWQLHILCALFGSPADALQRYHRKHHILNRDAATRTKG